MTRWCRPDFRDCETAKSRYGRRGGYVRCPNWTCRTLLLCWMISALFQLTEDSSSPFKSRYHRPLGTPVDSITQSKGSAPGRPGSKASGIPRSTTPQSTWTGTRSANLRAWNCAPCAKQPQLTIHSSRFMPSAECSMACVCCACEYLGFVRPLPRGRSEPCWGANCSRCSR